MKSLVSDEVDAAVSRFAGSYFRINSGAATDEGLQRCNSLSPLDSRRWGLILAGGDGTRLQGLTRMISGDDRPKQFCRVMGSQTLLEQAMSRAARSISPEQTMVALTRKHAHYYERDLAASCCRRLIQPSNRGTAPAIITALFQIARMDPRAILSILPSDHYYSDESAFTAALESALKIAEMRSQSVILLGAQPAGPETEFGWIELGAHEGNSLYCVKSFHEKPTFQSAERLFLSGALWNTFVVVGSVNALLSLAFSTVPDLAIALSGELREDMERRSLQVPSSAYRMIPSTDFSQKVLSPAAHRLLALRLQPMGWHDLGQPDRVVSIVRAREERPPAWMYRWEEFMRTCSEQAS